jgi:hypothetical protein
MRAANAWVSDFLPNAAHGPRAPIAAAKDANPSGPLRSIVERALQTRIGARVEQWEMTRKVAQLRACAPGNSEMDLNPDCCKGHVNAHHGRIYHAFQERLAHMKELGASCR